jgi:hypothetical protein
MLQAFILRKGLLLVGSTIFGYAGVMTQPTVTGFIAKFFL